MADNDDKTQAPSERRLAKAREEGQAPVSRELIAAAALGSAALVIWFGGQWLGIELMARLREMLTLTQSAPTAMRAATLAWVLSVGPLMGAVALTGVGIVFLQTGFLVHLAGALPDLARLDPKRGLKKIFGIDNAAEAFKALVKLSILVWAVWAALSAVWVSLPMAAFWTTSTLLSHLGREVVRLLLAVLALQVGIAVLDVMWTRWRFTQRMNMSREDLKQEHRESEGDPKVKGRLRQLRLARSKRRMLAAVANATVVVTNPTHYAVALSYERGGQSAPKIVAKGMDDVAARIRSAAEKAGVMLVANPPLARALYQVDLDAEVPAEHFKVVAELIAYVWRLREPARQAS